MKAKALILLLMAVVVSGCAGGAGLLGGEMDLTGGGWEPFDKASVVGVQAFWPITIDNSPNPRRQAMEATLQGAQSTDSFSKAGVEGDATFNFADLFVGVNYRYNAYPDAIFIPHWSWGVSGHAVRADWEATEQATLLAIDETEIAYGAGLYMRWGLDIRLGAFKLGAAIRYKTTTTLDLNSEFTPLDFGGKLAGLDYVVTLSLWPR